MKGYKALEKDWTCRGKKYQAGQIYEEDCMPRLCLSGMHFCEKLDDVFRFYPFDSEKTIVAEVEALGEVVTDGIKSCTNRLSVIREVPWDEIAGLVDFGATNIGICNIGKHNSGNENEGWWNSGDRNKGNHNSGNNNKGHYNSGFDNKGHSNSGIGNHGNTNSGHNNKGNCNSGNDNAGDFNSGSNNYGNSNTGDRNTGYANSGCGNYGHLNTGNDNLGSHNTGRCNRGLFNSGNHNCGEYNSGDWNLTSHSSGCFMTIEPKIMMFNKPSDWTMEDWYASEANHLINYMFMGSPVAFIDAARMSKEEKEAHPEYTVTGGYLAIYDRAETEAQEKWDELKDEDKLKVFSLPNFDPDIFTECTGIVVSRSYIELVEKRRGLICRLLNRFRTIIGALRHI